jgi:hypothetical protein
LSQNLELHAGRKFHNKVRRAACSSSLGAWVSPLVRSAAGRPRSGRSARGGPRSFRLRRPFGSPPAGLGALGLWPRSPGPSSRATPAGAGVLVRWRVRVRPYRRRAAAPAAPARGRARCAGRGRLTPRPAHTDTLCPGDQGSQTTRTKVFRDLTKAAVALLLRRFYEGKPSKKGGGFAPSPILTRSDFLPPLWQL